MFECSKQLHDVACCQCEHVCVKNIFIVEQHPGSHSRSLGFYAVNTDGIPCK